MTPLFRTKAVWITQKLREDIPSFLPVDCFAVIGNLGHECAGFAVMQEIGQTPPNGGWGWAQWTGPRRRAFETWCKEQNLEPSSDAANYGYLLLELKGSEKAAVAKTIAAKTLYDKTVAFEQGFERAGVPAYASRYRYAQDAQAAYNASVTPGSVIVPPTPSPPSPAPAVPLPAPAPAPWYVTLANFISMLVSVFLRKKG